MASPSTSDRWRRLEAIFNEALEMEAAARPAFLDQACGGDPELREEAESLLASADVEGDLMQDSIHAAAREFYRTTEPALLDAGSAFGHYEITRLIGAGGMGEVYLARDRRLDRAAAIKMLNPALLHDTRSRARFNQEARAASALNHPNILTIYEFGAENGVHFIASEYIEGKTLREKLAAGALPLNSAVDIAIQIAAGLAAAHAAGVIHRDIKPENVVVRSDGIAKILDFGIAKLDNNRPPREKSATFATETGMVIGSAKYMSPEQARGMTVDGRTDIFSLGTVLHEMVVGNAPPEWDGIIRKAICWDREQRYQTMTEMLEALQRFKADWEYREKKEQSLSRAALHPNRIRAEIFRQDETVAAATAAAARNKRWIAIAALAAALCAGAFVLWKKREVTAAPDQPRRLAILPFRNLKQDPATDFLGFSLADAVITKLGFVSAVSVRPSSAIDRYRNQVIDPRQVGAELDVDTLLTGTFLKDGDDLRITTQLVDVKLDKVTWQDVLDVKYDLLLNVQDHVAQQIIKGLALNLSPAEAENLKLDNPSDRVAYEEYLRGVDLYSLNDFSTAIDVLEKSAALDPGYALTWAHLGRAYTTNASLQFGGRDAYAKAQAAYEKALTLNPALIEPRVYMANLFTDTGRVEQAVPLLRLALQNKRNNAEAHWELGYAYRFAGMLRESVKECEQARRLDPKVKLNSSALNAYLYLGEYDKFLASLPPNNSVFVRFYRGFGEYYKGDLARTLEDFEHAFELDPSLLPAQLGKAFADAIRHHEADGIQLLNQTVNKLDERGVTDAEGIYKVAEAYAVLGDKAAALRILRRSIEGGFFCYPYFGADPLLNSLRNEAGFNPLLDMARLRHERFQAKFFSTPQ